LERGSQPPPNQLGGWGIAENSPSVVRGGALAARRFSCILQAPDSLSWNFLEAKFGEHGPLKVRNKTVLLPTRHKIGHV